MSVSDRLLPLFPLPVVLLPGALLPLHVFEPRYRELLRHCLETDRNFGLVHSSEGDSGAEAGAVGCVAHVEEVEPLEDGCSNIIVSGRERFRLREVQKMPQPYLVAAVEPFDDRAENPAELSAAGTRVRELFDRVARAAKIIGDEGGEPPELPQDPALVSFGIAAVIDLDMPARQQMLGSRSPLERLASLHALLSAALQPVEERARVHMRSRGNGRGPRGGAAS